MSDRAYRLSSLFDHFRGNLTAADLFTQGLGAASLAAAERALPVLEPAPVEDPAPLARPPRLPAVPRAPRRDGSASLPGLAASALAVTVGALALVTRRP